MSVESPGHTAWVTRDLDATKSALTGPLGVKTWARLPWIHVAPDACGYLGAPPCLHADISQNSLRDRPLELIALVRGPTIYSEFLDSSERGLRHVRVEADTSEDLDDAVAAATAHRARVPQRAVMPGGLRFDDVKQEQQ